MKFFMNYFKLDKQETMDNGEYAVCCPFEHKDEQGNPYHEQNPSAHINPENSTYHCKVCDKGFSEIKFVSVIEGIPYKQATQLLRAMDRNETMHWENFQNNLLNSPASLKLIKDLGLEDASELLRLGYSGEGISFPVFVYDELLDVRTYNPDSNPKVKSQSKAKNLIIPFDLWREDDSPTILCAGEKDMAILRAKKLNSITFTGGEMSFPKLFKHSFKDRLVYICYDNDQAGRDGALKAYVLLQEAGAIPHIVTGHYAVCTEKGEDIHDFFMKYGKTKEDFLAIIKSTEPLSPQLEQEAKEKHIPRVTLEQSTQGEYVNVRHVSSMVNVVSVFDDAFAIPDYVTAIKTRATEDCLYPKGHEWEWSLDDENIEDLLYLADSTISADKRDLALKRFMGIPAKEPFISIQMRSQINLWKAVVSDTMDTNMEEVKPMEVVVYSPKERLHAGKKYIMTHKTVSYPFMGLRIVSIVKSLEDIDTEISQFKLTNEAKTLLRQFQSDDIDKKMEELYERAKGFIGVEARREVTWATDLYFHTPLEFKFGRRTERAYLDVMIVGDPRTMKSQTAKEMSKMYELGTVVSLKTATIAGLIGGSDNTGGGWKTKIGLLPRSHKGAVIMEEFSGGGKETISKLTEIRSSNRVRITRVNGTTDVPAMVRMLSISNPVANGGISLSVKQYPSGIPILLDLVGASEDIARYDFFLLVDEPSDYISPLDDFDLEPFEKEAYMTRIRWVWSRTTEQIQIDRPVAEYIVKQAQEMNKKYDFHIKLFGPEAWKKIARIAIACAGMTVSTDENFENLIVTQQHVDFATRFLENLYNNDVFNLRKYVDGERKFDRCNEVDIAELQALYTSNSVLLHQLEQETEVSQRQLMAISGLKQDTFHELMNSLVKSNFIKWNGEKIVPTTKLRIGLPQMKQMYPRKAVEE